MATLDEPALVEWRQFRDDLITHANRLVQRLERDQFLDAKNSLAELRHLINLESKHDLLDRYEERYGPFGAVGPTPSG